MPFSHVLSGSKMKVFFNNWKEFVSQLLDTRATEPQKA